MTQKILEEFKQRIACLQLQPFDDGRFEVLVDGKKIFSKLQSHRFPEYSEIRVALQNHNKKG
ncbi:MAG: SelT/SelW/SelH family protein [Acidobacteria bacterium]|nr:SelT/SelW/SelH family protein [Acidobacteriota bacterium]